MNLIPIIQSLHLLPLSSIFRSILINFANAFSKFCFKRSEHKNAIGS